jgi:hypothetical protein
MRRDAPAQARGLGPVAKGHAVWADKACTPIVSFGSPAVSRIRACAKIAPICYFARRTRRWRGFPASIILDWSDAGAWIAGERPGVSFCGHHPGMRCRSGSFRRGEPIGGDDDPALIEPAQARSRRPFGHTRAGLRLFSAKSERSDDIAIVLPRRFPERKNHTHSWPAPVGRPKWPPCGVD